MTIEANTTDEYISIMEAARRIGKSDKQVRRWIHAGKLPARYPRPNLAEVAVKDLDAFLSGHTSGQEGELSPRVRNLEGKLQDLDDQVHTLTMKNLTLEHELKSNREQIDQLRRHLKDNDRQLLQLFAETGVLRHEQEQTVEEAEQEAARLRMLLDVERRYLEDITPRTFKAWLRKQYPSLPLSVKLLGDPSVPAKASRAMYEAHVRRLCSSEDDHKEFVRLWKLMLLSRA